MKIALINGSPKNKNSVSEYLLYELKKTIENIEKNEEDIEFYEYHIQKSSYSEEQLKDISKCDKLVFSFPLYVDGVPSNLLSALIYLEDLLKNLTNNKEKKIIYVLMNSGFYEGIHNKVAVNIMKNFSLRASVTFGGALCTGAGPILTAINNVPLGHGPKKNLGKALNVFAKSIIKNELYNDTFINVNFPRFAYKFLAERGWKQVAKKNGLKKRDLF